MLTKKEIIKRLETLIDDYCMSGSSGGHWLCKGVAKLLRDLGKRRY